LAYDGGTICQIVPHTQAQYAASLRLAPLMRGLDELDADHRIEKVGIGVKHLNVRNTPILLRDEVECGLAFFQLERANLFFPIRAE
jgi:hypothetical protein